MKGGDNYAVVILNKKGGDMKKIKIIILILIAICPNIVNASTYYISGDSYYVETPNNNEEVLEEEKHYRFYKETKDYSEDYYIEGTNPKEYPYQSDQYKKTEESMYSKEYPEELPGRIIKSRDIYVYKKRIKVNKLNISNIISSLNTLHINELIIYNNNNKFTYTPICLSCININNINDNNKETLFKISNNDTLSLEFNNDVYLDDLSIDLYISDPIGSDITSFHITTDNNTLDVFTEMTLYTKEQNSYKLSFDLKDYIKEEKEEKYYYETPIDNEEYIYLNTYKEYSYQDIKYLYYKIGKDYLDDYYKEKKGYIKDETQYKRYYKVRYLNKIILKENYVITSPYYNLYDMIEDSTIEKENIKIQSNIDITNNGLYKVTFIYNNYSIDQYVIVDREEQVESIVFTSRSNMKKAKKVESKKKELPKTTNNKNKSILNILFTFLKLKMSKETFDKLCRIGIFFLNINLYLSR